MKKLFFILVLCASCWISTQAQAQLDPQNPKVAQLSAEEIETWKGKQSLADWEATFGASAEWNPMQMEFYSQIKLLALSAEEKETLKAMSDEEWIAKHGEMDSWAVDILLLYSLVQNLKNE
ncbi:hypothetical protein [Hugenholtzia roseola]|uniref:hypothetical protein n=1 Tax=Hugenholtzia roseola TaxID=1002 RepID=UPI0004250631|nr:hypothetical protein [Hugenholtzia roseola]